MSVWMILIIRYILNHDFWYDEHLPMPKRLDLFNLSMKELSNTKAKQFKSQGLAVRFLTHNLLSFSLEFQ